MPDPRLQVDPGVPFAPLRPPGRSGQDTYVRPVGAGEDAAQLAQALSVLSPALARLGDVVSQGQNESDKLAGAQAARETVAQMDASRKTFAQMVKDGSIPAHQNPWMKQGYYEELGRTYAGRFQSDLTSAISTDENLKNTVEMKDFRTFTSNFEKDWMQTNIPQQQTNESFLLGFGSRRDAIVANLEAGWSAQTDERFKQRTLSMFRDDSQNFIHDALDRGTSITDIGTFLRQSWDDKHALGWDSKLTGTALIDAMANTAIERRDPHLLDQLLAAVPAGKDGSRLSSAYATHINVETQNTIAQLTREDWTNSEHQRTETSRSIFAEAGNRLGDAEKQGLPLSAVSVDDLQQRARANGDPQLDRQLSTMRLAYGNHEWADDPDTKARMLMLLHRSDTSLSQTTLDEAFQQHRLSLGTYNEISGLRREYALSAQQRAKEGTPGYLQHDYEFNQALAELKSQFGNNPAEDTADLEHRRNAASEQFEMRYYNDFLAPNAPYKGVTGQPKIDRLNQLKWDVTQQKIPDVVNSGAFRIRGGQVDPEKMLIDTPDRVTDWLHEIADHASDSTMTWPSPSLMAVFRNHGVDTTSKAAILKFAAAQLRLLPAPPPKKKREIH